MESNLSTNTTFTDNCGRDGVWGGRRRDGHTQLTPREHRKSGSINERGIINSLDKQGMNIDTSFTELIGNSIDAKATNIRIICAPTDKPKNILVTDDGDGMDRNGMDECLELKRENHTKDKSIGVSGNGMKAATKCLSNYTNGTPLVIYTHVKDGQYLKAIIDWGKIHETGKYTGSINTYDMNEDEIKFYKKYSESEDPDTATGTIIEIEKHDQIKKTLETQFKVVNEDKKLTPVNHMNGSSVNSYTLQFGNFPESLNIEYNYEGEKHTLDRYNPWIKFQTSDCYLSKIFEYTIWLVDIPKYPEAPQWAVLDDEENYVTFFPITGRSKNGEKIKTQIISHLIKPIHTLSLKIAYPRFNVSKNGVDKPYFDCEQPEIPSYTGTKKENEWEKNYDLPESQYNNKVMLVRNNNSIGVLSTKPNMEKACGGNSQKTKLKSCYSIKQLSYETNSSQNSDIDNKLGIQENKNQYQQPQTTSSLSKLLENCMDNSCNEVWTHFEKKVDERKTKEEAERKTKEEAERKTKEVERKTKEVERKTKEEAERKTKEEADKKANGNVDDEDEGEDKDKDDTPLLIHDEDEDEDENEDEDEDENEDEDNHESDNNTIQSNLEITESGVNFTRDTDSNTNFNEVEQVAEEERRPAEQVSDGNIEIEKNWTILDVKKKGLEELKKNVENFLENIKTQQQKDVLPDNQHDYKSINDTIQRIKTKWN